LIQGIIRKIQITICPLKQKSAKYYLLKESMKLIYLVRGLHLSSSKSVKFLV
jgi:hypothetical protein